MKIEKIILILALTVLTVFFTLVITLIASDKLIHPEKAIIGKWEEVEWSYEKADMLGEGEGFIGEFIHDQLKNEISKDLIIHKSEVWTFHNNSTITLKKKNQPDKKLKWRLKGRGHILKLAYDQGTKEFYQIKKLTKDTLVLHFENDTHARGIIKIIFKKVS